MTAPSTFAEFLLPVGFGLLGFVEPCTLGTTLVFIGFLEGKGATRKLGETLGFMGTRALVIGIFGALATILGNRFLGLQKGAWIMLGGLYVILGLIYLSGRIGPLMISIGPNLRRLSGYRGAAGLGFLFGLNIPACAAPLILVLLAQAASHGATGGSVLVGFQSLALFGISLSLPLVVVVLFAPARHAIDWLGSVSRRVPIATGLVLIAVGLWSIRDGVFVSIRTPTPGMAAPAMTTMKGS